MRREKIKKIAYIALETGIAFALLTFWAATISVHQAIEDLKDDQD